MGGDGMCFSWFTVCRVIFSRLMSAPKSTEGKERNQSIHASSSAALCFFMTWMETNSKYLVSTNNIYHLCNI